MKVVQAILPIGTVLNGQYIVESLLGKGSFGNVYLARDQDDKQKLFALAELINPKDQEGYRFTLEYVSHTSLNHRALPQAQYVFTDDRLGRKCLLVSYSEEPHLEMLRLQQPEQRFPLPQVMTIMAPIMSAVSHLHQRHPPVIHQNIKPASILVPRTTGEPVLVVLGIVKEQGSTTNPVSYFAPCYGAIEQYRGGFSTRSDIYGLGATFYILLTGIVPPDALYRSTQLESTGTDLLKPVNEVVPTIPTFVAKAIQQAMALEDDHRFSSVEQFWEALWSLGEYPSSVPGDMRSGLSHPFRVPRQAVVRPATISVPKRPRIPRIWKFGSFWPFAPKHRHAPQAGEPAVAEQTDSVGELSALAPPHPAGAINRAPTDSTSLRSSFFGNSPTVSETEEKPAPASVAKQPDAPQAGESAVPEHSGEPPAPTSVAKQPDAPQTLESAVAEEIDVVGDLGALAPPHPAGAINRAPTDSTSLRSSFFGNSPTVPEIGEPPAPTSVVKQPDAPQAGEYAVPEQTIAKPATVSIPKHPPRSWRLGILICGLLALFIVLVVGISLWFYAAAGTPAHSAIVTPRPTAPAVVTPPSQPIGAPTPIATTPVSGLPMVAGSYKGTIHNTPDDITSTMSLTNIKQDGGKMSGYFALGSGLLGDGFFTGMVDTARRIEFTVPGVFGNGPLHFSGIVQADGSLKGGYCTLDQTNHCNPSAGGYGTWNVKPAT